MQPTGVKFGDIFKITVLPKPFDQLEAENYPKGMPNYLKSSETTRREFLQRDADFQAITPAQGYAQTAGFTIVESSSLPEKLSRLPAPDENHAQGSVIYLVKNGPLGDDEDFYQHVVTINGILKQAQAKGVEISEAFHQYAQALLAALGDAFGRHAIELPKLSHDQMR